MVPACRRASWWKWTWWVASSCLSLFPRTNTNPVSGSFSSTPRQMSCWSVDDFEILAIIHKVYFSDQPQGICHKWNTGWDSNTVALFQNFSSGSIVLSSDTRSVPWRKVSQSHSTSLSHPLEAALNAFRSFVCLFVCRFGVTCQRGWERAQDRIPGTLVSSCPLSFPAGFSFSIYLVLDISQAPTALDTEMIKGVFLRLKSCTSSSVKLIFVKLLKHHIHSESQTLIL